MSFLVKAVSSVVKFLGHVSGGILGGVIGLFVGHKKSSTTKPVQRFNKTINPEEPRKIVFGKTASALDLRFWEVWGTSGANYDEVIALASHRINSVKEFYLENELAINATGTVQTVYSGVLTRAYNLGAYGQTALSVGSGSQWTSASKFDGVAHAVYKWVPNDKQLPSGIPNRYTQVIEGAPVYDPRRDSTQSGGSGAHRITDRTTWDYAALDANSVPIGRNNALQVLWYLLGWYVPNAQTSELVLTCGRGIDPTDINIASFITAANNCEAAGYYTDGILSTGDPHTDNEDKLTGSGLIGTLIDPGGLWSYYANVDDTASIDAYLTDDDITDNAGTSWNDFKPMSEQFVQVVGKFNDPGTNALYQARAYPMVRDTTYEAALGVKRRKTIDFDFIQDSLLAQKLARLALNTGQYQGELTASVNYRVMKAQLWSVVSYTSDRFGWTKLFRIRGFTISPQDGVQIALREINASIWSAGSVTTPAAISAGTKYDPRQEVAVAGLAGAAYTSAASDGTTLDGMLLSWTAAPANVLRTEIQYRQNGLTSWETLPPINGDTSSVAVANLLSGTVYNVRARHITNFEVESAWVNLSPDFTVGNSRRVLWTTVSGTTGAPSDNATVGATWGTNVGSRPAELTDGRIVAALDSAGDLARNITTARSNSSALLRYTGGGLFSGELTADTTSTHTASAITGQAATATSSDFAVLTGATKPANNATVGGTWGVDIGARPAELTDGRVAVALDSAGDLARNITTARANSSAILRYSGGGLFSGELTADQTSTHTASAFTGQGALATLGTVTYGTGTVTGFGAMAARAKVSLGDGFVFKNDGTTSLTDALAVTSLGVAASITGQGTGATASNLSGLNATEGTKLSGIQSLADVTAAAQVTVEMNTNLDVAADSLGAINADNLAALLWSAYVYKGGTSIKGDNNTSYALADIYGKTSGTGFAVDNTNGSSTKGIITVASGTVLAQTSGGNLVVTVAGVVQPKIPFKATRLDAPPTPPAPTGGVKSVTWVSGEFVGINSASYVTVLASLKSVVIATGESLYGTATLDYLIGGDTSASARTMSYKFQYSVTGANSWNDFPTGTTPATGTSASNSGGRGAPEYEPVSHDPGSVTISQSKATPGANTYDLRLVAITNTTGRTMTTSGTAKVEAKV